MMKKIHVNIDSNPVCYREAARLFKELNSILCPTLKEQITLTGIPVTNGCCALDCPIVQINGQTITRATAGDVVAAIREAAEAPRMVA
jgi:hypothetical protein